MPRRARLFATALLLIPLGIAWRMAPLHLSPFAYKWGGSLLWAAMVYFLVAAALPAFTSTRVALIAGSIATLVELSRLLHIPALDAFRLTLAGRLLLGRVFSAWDIAAYWAAIALAARLDRPTAQLPR